MLIAFGHHMFLSHPQDPSVRIFIIVSYTGHARQLLCEVAPHLLRKHINYPQNSYLHVFVQFPTQPTLTHVSHMHSQAYHLNLHYPHHTFITTGWYAPKWWLVKNPSLSCTPQQRESVLPLSFAVLQYVFIEDLNMTTDTGIVSPPLCLLVLYIALGCKVIYIV